MIGRRRPAGETRRVRAARAKVAEGLALEAIEGRELLSDANRHPDLQHLRESGLRARATLRLQRTAEYRAHLLSQCRSWSLKAGIPLLVGFGVWSTTGVHEAMAAGLSWVDPWWWGAWLVEPAIIGLVATIILIRAAIARGGGRLSGWATVIEFAALFTSIGLNLVGTGMDPVHVMGPIGAALTATLITLTERAVSTATPDVTPTDTASATPSTGEPHPLTDTAAAHVDYVRALVADAYAARAGEERDAETEIRALCDIGIADIERFLSGGGLAGGGVAQRPGHATDPLTTREANAAGHAGDLTGEQAAQIGDEQAERPNGEPPVSGQGDPLNTLDQGDSAEPEERGTPAVDGRRAVADANRERVAHYLAHHPNARTGEIADALGLSPATVKRHRRALDRKDR